MTGSLAVLPEDMYDLISYEKTSDIYSIKFLHSIGSTNDEAKEIAKAGNADGLVIVADSQTMGRGRADHKWFSPKGVNIYLSIVRSFQQDINELFISNLNLAVSEAICLAILKISRLNVYSKWPNDIYYGDKKLGGVLIESLICGQAIRFIVIGIGINVNVGKDEFPLDIQDRATSILIETGHLIIRGKLICSLLTELYRCLYI